MKFRHSLTVFIDNFSVTYKQLLYRLIVTIIAITLYTVIITPYVNALTGSSEFINFTDGIRSFIQSFFRGDIVHLGEASEQIETAFDSLLNLVSVNLGRIAWGIVAIVAVHAVEKFFAGLGNYATAAVINDKMALRARSPFLLTLIRNLKEACLYNLMYVPMSMVYDAACAVILYFLVFKLIALIPFVNLFIEIFLFITAGIVLIAVKMTFTSDWLPSLIRGKAGQKKAFLYTFARRGKQTFNVLSNFVVMILIIFAVNVCGILFTFGAAALLTIPSSYVIFVCFEFVNYYDHENLKYFIDKNTIIKPEKERTPTREEFFRGDN